MSESTSNGVLHPTNPGLLKDLNIPKEKGQTRTLPDGSLLYREPLTDTEVPAIRLDDIRPRLVHEASKKKSYRFPKKRGYDYANVTAFLKKDYNYGPERENRPDRLFQIQKGGVKGEEPNGYVMDEGRVVLDAFDHGLRNFGDQLPMYVSSELEGHDIEDYLRRNWQISVYDLVARAPNGYYKGGPETEKGKKTKKTEKAKEWHEGPPRVGTFSMRATRFRLRTGCLSWEKKDGTAAKNQRILDLIPAQYKDPAVNSTKGWRDLDKSEIKKIGDGAKRKPQQGPKEKRAALAKKVQDETDNHFPGFPEDREDIQHGEEDAWIYASNWQTQSVQSGNGPKDSDGSIMAPQMYNTDFQSTTLWQPPSAMYETSVDFENDPSRPNLTQPRQQSEGSLNADFDGGTHHRAQKRKRFDGDAEGRVNEGGTRLKKARIESQEPRSGRQQQRTLAPNPYGPQTTSPSTAYTAAGNLSIGQEPFLAWSGDFADLVTTTQEDHSTTYNSIGVANVDSLLPDTHDSMWQHESSSRFPQSQLLPSTEATSKRKRTNSSTTEHFEGQHPTKRTKGDTIETAPIAETQTPTEPAPTLVDSIPTTTFEIPTPDFWQSDTWGTPLEPSINIPSSPYGEPWNAEPAPSLVDFIPTTTFEIPTPEYWQPDTWGTPLEPSTNMLPIDDQQGLLDPFATGPPPDLDLYTQAYGPVHFDADSPFGLYDNPYPLGDIHPPADFYSGQWEAGQAADPTEFDPGWTV